MFPLWFTFLGGSFVFLHMGPSILFLVFPLFWVLWFIYDWQGFIIITHKEQKTCEFVIIMKQMMKALTRATIFCIHM
jgi:hypothetical protein